MKKILALFLTLTLAAGLAACGQPKESLADYGVPEDFNIYYEFGVEPLNVLDTYTDTIQKDLCTPEQDVAKAEVVFTAQQKAEIYKKLQQYEITSLTQEMTIQNFWDPDSDSRPGKPKPTEGYTIRVTADGKTYTVTGDSSVQGWDVFDKKNGYIGGKEVRNFNKFIEFMGEMYRSLPEYKALPEAKGGYR